MTVAAECYKYILTMDNGRLIDLSEKYKSQVIQKDDFFLMFYIWPKEHRESWDLRRLLWR